MSPPEVEAPTDVPLEKSSFRSVLRLPEMHLCLALSLACLGGAVVCYALPHRRSFANPRVVYALHHAPLALLLSALVLPLLSAILFFLFRRPTSTWSSTPLCLAALIAAFALFWLPVWHGSGFVQDDWLLLSAASIRHSLWSHPLHAWFSLDSVDGNFRPLGAVLFWTWLFPRAGLHAGVYLAANFLLNLATVLLLFAFIRKLGYSLAAASLAALLLLSRGLLYTENAWISALGDCLVSFLCLLTLYLLLGALASPSPRRRLLLHVLAWLTFCVSLLAKQSSFSIPLIVSSLLLLGPGAATVPLAAARRRRHALFALLLYGLPTVFVFLHGRQLMHGQTPYPIGLTLTSVLDLFSYLPWYVVSWNFPEKFLGPNLLLQLVGLLLTAALAYLVHRYPSLRGRHPRDLAFLLAATLCSLLPFLLLATRNQPYYGMLAALWASAAGGILLTQYGPAGAPHARAARITSILATLLVVTGYLDVRLAQTGLIPSGGYVWGTSGVSAEGSRFRQLAQILDTSSHRSTLVLVDAPIKPSYYANMALLLRPDLERIVVYNSARHEFLVNDRLGRRPDDTTSSLSDIAAFHWTEPLDPAQAAALDPGLTQYVRFDNSGVHPGPPPAAPSP